MVFGLLAALSFGAGAPLIAALNRGGSALSAAALLYLGAAIALLAVRLLQGSKPDETPLQRQDWPALAGLTVLGGIAGPLALVLALQQLPAAAASLLLNLEAVFTLLIAVLIGREHLGRRGLFSAGLTLAGAVVVADPSLAGTSLNGALLLVLATLAWGMDNNLSQRLSLRDPMQIALAKSIGASLPMLMLALVLKQPFPPVPQSMGLLLVGASGYGLSIWFDLLALRGLGAAREAVIFSSAPFVGALLALLLSPGQFQPSLLIGGLLMASGVVVLLGEAPSHQHPHSWLRHTHRHRHSSADQDPHHDHGHNTRQEDGLKERSGSWHAHEHEHHPLDHEHPHVSDSHHRHRHDAITGGEDDLTGGATPNPPPPA